jgi:hypothetical protein
VNPAADPCGQASARARLTLDLTLDLAF